ncbi:MAG: hypothetical protein ACE15E_11190, partial [Acidobacteriota bacterium]
TATGSGWVTSRKPGVSLLLEQGCGGQYQAAHLATAGSSLDVRTTKRRTDEACLINDRNPRLSD